VRILSQSISVTDVEYKKHEPPPPGSFCMCL